MKKIRFGVFETNSSSTHSITIVPLEEFEAWKSGKLLFNGVKKDLQTREEIEVVYEERKKYYEDVDEFIEEECLTYKEWYHQDDLETFVHHHTTKSGEELVAFGSYGRND